MSAVSVCDGEPNADNTVAAGTNFPGLTVEVLEAPGEKCQRCWMQSAQVNADGLCPRCAHVVSLLPTDSLEV